MSPKTAPSPRRREVECNTRPNVHRDCDHSTTPKPAGASNEMPPGGLLGISAAARAFPAINGRHPHNAAVWRWCRKGLEARDGSRVKLRHTRLGRQIAIAPSAITEFLDALAAADAAYFDNTTAPAVVSSPPRASSALRRKQIAAAEVACARRGI